LRPGATARRCDLRNVRRLLIDDEHDREQALRGGQAATSPTTQPETRTFAEADVSILEARCVVSDQMVQSWFLVEVGDLRQVTHAISRLRNLDSVFDCYRVMAGG